MSDYPLPSYAAHIWLAGDEIVLAFPSPLRQTPESSTTVKFQASEKGAKLLLAILKERTRSSNMISTLGCPVGYDVERIMASDQKYKEWLRAMTQGKETSAKEKAEAMDFLEELGL